MFRAMNQITQYASRTTLVMLLALTGIPATLAQTPTTPQEIEYHSCMQMTRLDPETAFEQALQWQDAGGGIPARHCAAAALMMLEHYLEAAERFEALARDMPDDAPPEIVSDILAHAGIAWTEAGDLEHAYAVQTAALALYAGDPAILLDRAFVLYQLDRFWDCIDDLNAALELDPYDPAALAMRASAYRFVQANELAMDDAQRALEIDPNNAEALLERGILHRLAGNNDAARQDWLRLIELHDGRPAADNARRNLELLDVNPDAQ